MKKSCLSLIFFTHHIFASVTFNESIISTNADGAKSVHALDMDGDGDMDVLSTSYSDDKVAWYENDGSQNFTEQVISTNA
ncbi:MAG: hypothetical protein CMG60_08385, partial [Candidatus Marinimicrobia bacterium]|nr:hypothetical protein [Candidatus Neomarinimicrobiota bacterium]